MMWFRLAWTNVWANARRSLLVVGAVALGVLALVLYAGYVNGVQQGLRHSTIRGGVGHLQLSGVGGFDGAPEEPLQFGLTAAQMRAIQARADEMPEVRVVAPRVTFGGMVSSGTRTLSFAGAGLDPEAEASAFGVQPVTRGEALSEDGPPDGILLGVELARQLGVGPGDVVTLMAPTVTGALNATDGVVRGLVSSGSPQGDLYLLRARLPAVQALLGTDKLSYAAVLLRDDADPQAVGRRLAATAAGIEMRDWLQLSPFYHQVVAMYEGQFRTLGGLIVAITLVGVAAMILTSVLERTREIGVMRSLGVHRRLVRVAFVLEGVILCGLGLAAGTALAWGADIAIETLKLTVPPPPGRTTGYPLVILWSHIGVAEIWAAILLLGVVASWLASGRVASLTVVEALRAA